MRHRARRSHPDRWPRYWAVMVLCGGVMATVLLVATVTDGQAGGLFDGLFTQKSPQRAETAPSQGNTPLATVRLHVEGMVCYG
jgi:hypothetical protein